MKKILLLLLLATFSIQAQTLQNPTYGNVKLKNNTTDNSATKVNVQSTDGTINTISKSDLVNVVEVNDVPSLPLIGKVGKIYVVKNVNKIYRWNGTFYQELAGSDISGLQAQIDLKANDSDVVKLTGDQTISGQKSFSLTGKIDMQTDNVFPAISVTALGSNGMVAAQFINNSSSPYSSALRLQTGSSGGVGNTTLNVWNQSSIGIGIASMASNGGVSISSQSGNGDSYVSNITSGGTGRNYVGRNDGTETYSVDKTGNVIGNSYIKRSTPANNILLAGGDDLSQNTAFNKNFGTTAGTIVEGGTLGSNAYTSTPYLPLSGGTLTGIVTAPTAPAGTNTTQIATTAFVSGGLAIKENAFTKNTAFNKNFGTTAGTVVEGGTLGSNAYNSTAYLPLSGGTLTGDLKVPRFLNTILTNSLASRNSFNSFNANDVVLLEGWVSADFGGIGTEDRVVLGSGFSGKAIIGGHSRALTAWADLIINPDPNSGNVGIGTATPTARLDVAGSVKGTSATFSSSVTATSFNGSATLTGTPTAPTAAAGTNTTQIATTAFVQANARPYKVYTALLTQSGTNAPVATVLENTLGGTVVWSRNASGVYYATLAGSFTINKTFVSSSNRYIGFTPIFRLDSNIIYLATSVTGSTYVDNVLENNSIEIRVYN